MLNRVSRIRLQCRRPVHTLSGCVSFWKRLLLVLVLFYYGPDVMAQTGGRFNNWYFGNKAGITFTSGSPVAVTDGQLVTTEGCASMSDPAGNLLFYTDGVTIWNKNHLVMTNGTGLTGHASSTQSAVIVKKPLSNTIYYVFTADADASVNGIRYTEVNLSLSGGLGAVTANKNIALHAPSCEKIVAVRHCNNRDLWIVSHDWNTNGFRTWLVSPAGVNTTPVLSNSGTVITGINQSKYGQLKANVDGNKILAAHYGYTTGGANKVELYDFNNSTGVISGSFILSNEIGAYGCEFSPNGRVAYAATNGGNLIQYNLCAGSNAAISASRTLIVSLGPFIGSLQLGPDGKIYVSRNSTSLSVINNPNTVGTGCGFVNAAIPLSGKNSGLGLPNLAAVYIRPPTPPFTSIANCLTVNFTCPTVAPANNSCNSAGSAINSLNWNFGDPGSGASNTSTQTNPTHVFSAIGTYPVRLILNMGCYNDTLIQNVNVTGFNLTMSTTGTSCSSSSGSATATPALPGTYTYLWNNGGTSQTITGLAPGNYNVTVTSSNGCTAIGSVNVTGGSGLNAMANGIDVSCFGTSTGSAIASAIGGASPYTYLWSNGATTSVINNLAVGIKTVTITDANGCTASASVTISQPTDLVLTGSFTPALCGSPNGSVSVSVIGGTSPYTYSWNTTPAQNTATANGLSSGNYTITVTDAKGCSKNTTVTIPNTGSLNASASVNNQVSCFGGNNGSASASPSGGTAPYSYLWSNGSTTAIVNNLPAGNHSVNIKDASGCTASASVTITQPTVLVLTGSFTPALCGSPNGSVSVAVSGGTSPYTYSWNTSPAQNTATANGLSSGNYTVTVTDAKGCSKNTTVTIPNTGSLNASASVNNQVICFGGNNGSASASPSGGTAPYTYLWSNGSTTSIVNNLPAGNHSVNITDAIGCTASASVNITQPTDLLLTGSFTPALCGSANGSVSVSVSGGTSPYTYSWNTSPAQNTATANGLSSGNYTLTVTDAKGCSKNTTVTIPNTGSLNASASVNNQVSCFGGNDGSASASPSGGTTPYSYLWSNGSTTAIINNLPAGNHSISIKDASGCTASASVTITQPTDLILTGSFTPALCGSANGSVSVAVSGGTSPYTYSWNTSPAQNTATANGLSSGNYTVTATDAKGCSKNTTVTIPNTGSLNASASVNNQVSCFGGNNGSASASPSGGTAPFTYLWSNGSTTAIVNNLPAGNHSVNITDASGCTASASVSISQPTDLVLTGSFTPALCGSANGSVSVSVSGGTSPYTYSWNTSPAQNTATANGLSSGNYSVTATDAKGCSKNTTVTIPNTGSLNASASVNNQVSCFGGSNGSASASPSGGTAPYTYLWSNGITTATVNNLPVGNHSVSISDASGCTASASVSISQPTDLVLTGSFTPALCGSANGSVSVVVSGGTSPYTYSWNTTPAQNTATANGLSSGNYTVTVTDAKGCSKNTTVTIPNTGSLNASASVNNQVSCFGGNNGSASASPSGGTAPYTYLWSNGATTAIVNNLPAGNHSVNISDASGCTASASVTITEPSGIHATYISTPSACNASMGTITISPNGGTGIYTFKVDSGSSVSNPFIQQLTAGVHLIEIADQNGCILSDTVIVPSPAGISVSVNNIESVNCSGFTDGKAQATIIGGVAPYTYNWSSGENTAQSVHLNAGSNHVSITDAAGCTAAITFIVPEPTPLNARIDINNVLCYEGTDGSIDLSISGGTAPWQVSWTDGGMGTQRTNVTAGTYIFRITDNMGCVLEDTLSVIQPAAPLQVVTVVNPDRCGNNSGSITAIASGGSGSYTYIWNSLPNTNDPIAGSLSAGTYAVTVRDSQACEITVNAVLPNYPPFTVQVDSIKSVSCHGGQDGMVYLKIIGGTGNVSYNWGYGVQNHLPEGFPAGTYNLQIQDTAGCMSTVQFIIDQPDKIVASTTTYPVSCYGRTDGRITLSVSGGSLPLSYLWSDGSGSVSATGLPAGLYWCKIKDEIGCELLLENLEIQGPEKLEVTLTAKDPDCSGNPNGSITSSVTGGAAPYDYKWSNNIQSADLNNLGPGTYILNVNDRNGCFDQDEASLRERGNFKLEVQGDSLLCMGESTTLTAVVPQGQGHYTFTWDHGVSGTEYLANPSETTTYTVYATDQEGCSRDTSFTVKVNALPDAIIRSSGTMGCAPFCLSIVAESNTQGLQYAWSTGTAGNLTTAEIMPCYATPGVYPIGLTLTDQAGCTNTLNWDQRIVVYPAPEAMFTASPNEASLEDPFFSFRNFSKGATSYSYDFGDPMHSVSKSESPSFTYRDSGVYEVKLIVTNEAGCADSATIKVMVRGMETFYLPSAFTPDQDGLNDYFLPKFIGQSPTGYEMHIYNRWGEEIFFSDQWEKGWDGTYKGEKVSADMYVCKIRYMSSSGHTNDQITSVTITE